MAAPAAPFQHRTLWGSFSRKKRRRKFRGTCSVCSLLGRSGWWDEVAYSEQGRQTGENGAAPTKGCENLVFRVATSTFLEDLNWHDPRSVRSLRLEQF